MNCGKSVSGCVLGDGGPHQRIPYRLTGRPNGTGTAMTAPWIVASGAEIASVCVSADLIIVGTIVAACAEIWTVCCPADNTTAGRKRTAAGATMATASTPADSVMAAASTTETKPYARTGRWLIGRPMDENCDILTSA